MKNQFIKLFVSFGLFMLSMYAYSQETPAPNETKTEATFPLKEGDVWVFFGDSITAQHLHTNYFEAFCFARYQKINFSFRNSGESGNTIVSAMTRFSWDVAPWKPTVVSVELGMNDRNGFTVDKYIENMGKLNELIKSINARPIFFTASPINNGDTSDNLGNNARLKEFADALKIFATSQNAPFADQFNDLLDIWGKNKPREVTVAIKTQVEQSINLKNLPGSTHLKAYLEEVSADKTPTVVLTGDPVHPGAPGQLMMTASLLKNLKADGFVSSATISNKGEVIESKGCLIENAKFEKDILTFSRTDECLPFPIPVQARSAVAFYPAILELSQYTLKITGLTGAKYNITINKVPSGVFSGSELEAGINLTNLEKGPIATQSNAILTAVNSKESLVSQWRTASKAASAQNATEEAKQKVEFLNTGIIEADAKIRAAAKPIKLDFEISVSK